MPIPFLLLLFLFQAPTLVEASCGLTAPSSAGSSYLLRPDPYEFTLYRCTGSDCSEAIAQLAGGTFTERLKQALQEEVTFIGTVAACIEKDLLDQDNLFRRIGSLSDIEKARLSAAHVESLQEVSLVRQRLDAAGRLSAGFQARLVSSPVDVLLSPSGEPLLRRLALQVFGIAD